MHAIETAVEREDTRKLMLAEDLIRITMMLLVFAASGYMAADSMAANAETCTNATFRAGLSRQLSDCRAYEQVSPVAKGGFDASSRLPFLQYPVHASPNGEAIAYIGDSPFANAQSSLFPDAHLSRRSEESWQTSDVTPPTPSASLGSSEAYDFSEDLSQVVIKIPGQALTTLPEGNAGLFNLFLHATNGGYTLVNSASPAAYAPEGEICHEAENCYEEFDLPAFAGASSDFQHLLFETNDSLIGTGAPGGSVPNLYESSGLHVHLVGVLPDETIATSGAVAGSGGSEPYRGQWSDVNHAISADGKRVIFEATADGGQPAPAQQGMTELYDRLEGSRTVEISAPAIGPPPANPKPQPAQFWTASTDGSLVFFASNAELTTNANTGTENNSSDLYRYDVNNGEMKDLTVDTNPIDASTGSQLQGVIGSNVDGSTVYFVADGELISGEGIDGQPNLYRWNEDPLTHQSHLDFIATLSERDSRDWTPRPTELRAYVTPDGAHLALMSFNSLTGYDNIDLASHKADSEVYMYSAETRTLRCASCDPEGRQPVGGAYIGAAPQFLASTPFYQPRVLSDDGARLFFSSLNPLTTADTSPYAKVYEYEQVNVGSCRVTGGCLYLISDGKSGEMSATDVFLDADSTGDNVFFATLSRLAPSDTDKLFDVYDARVGGGFASPVSQVPCTGCTRSTTGSGASPPSGSQLVRAGVTDGSGNFMPPASTQVASTSKPVKLSCRAKARAIRNAKTRQRALKRCPRPKRANSTRRAGR